MSSMAFIFNLGPNTKALDIKKWHSLQYLSNLSLICSTENLMNASWDCTCLSNKIFTLYNAELKRIECKNFSIEITEISSIMGSFEHLLYCYQLLCFSQPFINRAKILSTISLSIFGGCFLELGHCCQSVICRVKMSRTLRTNLIWEICHCATIS